MTEPLALSVQELLAILSFASKSAEMLGQKNPPYNPVDLAQWKALAKEAEKILARFDRDNPAMLPLPHDGLAWKDRVTG